MVSQTRHFDTPNATKVPLHTSPICGLPAPTLRGVCTRATGHTGRHAWFWRRAVPGLVRETWATCQVCGRTIRDNEGPVCSQCGN